MLTPDTLESLPCLWGANGPYVCYLEATIITGRDICVLICCQCCLRSLKRHQAQITSKRYRLLYLQLGVAGYLADHFANTMVVLKGARKHTSTLNIFSQPEQIHAPHLHVKVSLFNPLSRLMLTKEQANIFHISFMALLLTLDYVVNLYTLWNLYDIAFAKVASGESAKQSST